MSQRGIRWVTVGLVFIAVGVKAESQATTKCANRDHSLVYIGTYGQLQPAGFSPAGDANQPGATFDKTQGIYAACLDTKTGGLKMLGLASDVNRASWVSADPTRPILYSTGLPGQNIRDEGNIFSFTVDRASGKLRLINKVGSGGEDPTHLAIDEKSHTLFVANHDGGKITTLPIKENGGLEAVISSQTQEGSGPSPRQSNAHPHGVTVDPTGHYVLSADFGADRVFVYHFDPATKSLSPASPPFEKTATGAGPRHLAFHPNGRFVFLDTELSAELICYKWDSVKGHLELVQDLPLYPPTYKGTKSAADLEFSRDGRFLYVSLRGDQNSIIVFKVDPKTAALSEVQRIPSQGKTPWDFAIDPTGNWMLVANVGSNSVAVLRIDAKTGMLTTTGEPLSMLQPNSIAFVSNR